MFNPNLYDFWVFKCADTFWHLSKRNHIGSSVYLTQINVGFCLVSNGILDQALEHMHNLKDTFINLFITAFPEVFWSNAEF